MGLQGSHRPDIDQQKSAAAVGLGLAVLAGLCRVQKLAAASAMIEKAPLLLKVCLSTYKLNSDQHMLDQHMLALNVCSAWLSGHAWLAADAGPHHATSLETLQH